MGMLVSIPPHTVEELAPKKQDLVLGRMGKESEVDPRAWGWACGNLDLLTACGDLLKLGEQGIYTIMANTVSLECTRFCTRKWSVDGLSLPIPLPRRPSHTQVFFLCSQLRPLLRRHALNFLPWQKVSGQFSTDRREN